MNTLTTIAPPTASKGKSVCGGNPDYVDRAPESAYATRFVIGSLERSLIETPVQISLLLPTRCIRHAQFVPKGGYSAYARTTDSPAPINDQIDRLSSMNDGWLDGDGAAPSQEGLEGLRTLLKPLSPIPTLYPTPEGGVQAEWSIGDREISLEIDLDSLKAEWHDLNTSTTESSLREVDLSKQTDLRWIAQQLGSFV